MKVTGNIPIEFLANKADLKDQMAVTEGAIKKAADSHSAPWTWTSAKTGEGVERAFAKLAQMIAARNT